MFDRQTNEPPLDFTVRVNRSVRPPYPNWSGLVMHPKLEEVGPAEYDLRSDVEQWTRDDQKTSVIVGNTIYETLKRDNALADQLGLADLLAIQKMGIKVFRELFKGKAAFGWRSVVQDRYDRLDLRVPYLIEDGGEVARFWAWVGSLFNASNRALRFRK